MIIKELIPIYIQKINRNVGGYIFEPINTGFAMQIPKNATLLQKIKPGIIGLILILTPLFNSNAASTDTKSKNNDVTVKTNVSVKPSETPNNTTTEKPEATNDDSAKKTWNYGSLMLDAKTSGWLNEAIKSRDQQIPLEILLPSLFPTSSQASIEEKPADVKADDSSALDVLTNIIQKPEAPKDVQIFYLKSILYFSPDNWSLWLNDKKISDKDNLENIINNISIIKITHDEVIILWKKSQIDLIYPGWRNNFTSMDNIKFVSAKKNIIVDAISGDISFVLKPNQSLLPKSLEIVEGSGKPVSSTQALQPVGQPGVAPGLPGPATNQSLTNSSKNNLEIPKNLDILKSIVDYGKNMQTNVDKVR